MVSKESKGSNTPETESPSCRKLCRNEVMNLSYTPRRFVPLPPAVLPPPGQPTTDPIMPGDLGSFWWSIYG